MADLDEAALPGRRDFIVQLACAFAGVGGALALWPFLDQMNPNDASPPPETRDVDLQPIEPGQVVSVIWRGKPVFIRHRTRAEVELARRTPLRDLPDTLARNEALPARTPADDANRTKEGHDSWLVVVGLCTHMGCVLTPQDLSHAPAGEGWFCRCHAARFDLSGRVRSGPARTNLPVPPYRFLTASKIRIG
jgi:ubiquinol-cytochrome c reductase iron-sulfur subunit